ncbi:MAG: sodium-dependent transporter, partial [Victivallales bacterium]|nr:sodium-dependent transporter [Victivallales bacterium]
MAENTSRETLATRLGFILLSAGCAIGLGNVWRFPFIVGQYGGGIFVFLYLFFLLILGFPIMMTEMAIGRGGRSNLVGSFRNLATSHRKAWTWLARIMISGCLILMIYYTSVSGWLFSYTGYFARGTISNATEAASTGK